MLQAGGTDTPEWMLNLPSLWSLLSCAALSPAGEWFLELFCGGAILTLACSLSRIPCVQPWDLKFSPDMDVVRFLHTILLLIFEGYIVCVHFGTPCHSCTLARSPAMRSLDCPQGVSGLSVQDQWLLDNGNALIDASCRIMETLWSVGGYFSCENPWQGFLWLQPRILKIHSLAGVVLTTLPMSAYNVCYDKSAGVLHNLPFGWKLGAAKDFSRMLVVLRGKACSTVVSCTSQEWPSHTQWTWVSLTQQLLTRVRSFASRHISWIFPPRWLGRAMIMAVLCLLDGFSTRWVSCAGLIHRTCLSHSSRLVVAHRKACRWRNTFCGLSRPRTRCSTL